MKLTRIGICIMICLCLVTCSALGDTDSPLKVENGMLQPEDVPRFVGHIRREAARLVTLIEDIIRLSQLDEGSELPREDVDLRLVVEEVLDQLQDAADNARVSLSVTGSSRDASSRISR